MQMLVMLSYSLVASTHRLQQPVQWVVEAGWWRVHRARSQESKSHSSDTNEPAPREGPFSFLVSLGTYVNEE